MATPGFCCPQKGAWCFDRGVAPVGLLGQSSRILSLARALAGRPRLLLVDDPRRGLAPLVVRRLLDALRAAADGDGLGVVLVEQRGGPALEVADRVCVLHRGQVVIESSPAEILKEPGTFERAYIGRRGSACPWLSRFTEVEALANDFDSSSSQIARSLAGRL